MALRELSPRPYVEVTTGEGVIDKCMARNEHCTGSTVEIVLFTQLLDTWLLFLSAVLAVLVARIAWISSRRELSQPADWSATERSLGRLAAWGLAIAALVSGLTAVYVSMRVPWVENFLALLPNPPKVVAGKQPAHISTASYLFGMPVGLGLCAAMLTDPWALRVMRFRGPRRLVLGMLPLIGVLFCGISLWRSIDALSTTIR